MMGYVMSSVPIHGIKPSSPGISVTLPDSNTILSFHTANLNITGLPSASRQCPILLELTSATLLSIGLLCYHYRDDNFYKKLVKTSLNGVPILTVPWSRNGIWNITQTQVPKPSNLHSNLVTYMATKKVSDWIYFYHPTMFSPLLLHGVVPSMKVNLPLGSTLLPNTWCSILLNQPPC